MWPFKKKPKVNPECILIQWSGNWEELEVRKRGDYWLVNIYWDNSGGLKLLQSNGHYDNTHERWVPLTDGIKSFYSPDNKGD